MNISKEQSERIEKRKQEWAVGDHHTGLMSVAWTYKKEGVPLQEAITDMQAFYTSIEESGKHDEHVREVEEAFSKVYEFDYSVHRKPAKADTTASYKAEQMAWLSAHNDDTELRKGILEQDVSDKRTTTIAALKSIFRHTSGRIRYGQTINTIRWAETSDGFSAMANSDQCVYMTTTTFGDIIDNGRQEELAEKIGISVALGVSTDELIFGSANGRELALGQLSEAIEDCTEREINIITDTVKALKVSLRRHC